jgi:hypothetical protein
MIQKMRVRPGRYVHYKGLVLPAGATIGYEDRLKTHPDFEIVEEFDTTLLTPEQAATEIENAGNTASADALMAAAEAAKIEQASDKIEQPKRKGSKGK